MMIKSTSSRAFTLVETLVAISILTVAIIGPFVAIQNALMASYAARDQLVASMLAQEAIEYVRAVRDSNYIYIAYTPGTTRSWFYGLDSTGGTNCVDPDPNDSTPVRCMIDTTQDTVTHCGSGGNGTCTALNRSTANNVYTQASGHPATQFTRSVTLSAATAEIPTREMRVTVVVSWMTGHRFYSITLTEVLAKWL